jgi:hypothetical protein
LNSELQPLSATLTSASVAQPAAERDTRRRENEMSRLRRAAGAVKRAKRASGIRGSCMERAAARRCAASFDLDAAIVEAIWRPMRREECEQL